MRWASLATCGLAFAAAPSAYAQNIIPTGFQSVSDISPLQMTDIAYDVNGDLLMTGFFSGTLTLGTLPTLTSAGAADVVVAKRSGTTGAWLWAVRAGGTGDDFSRGLALSPTGTMFVSGFFYSAPASFGAAASQSAINGSADGFVAALDASNGAFIWSTKQSANGTDVANNLAFDVTSSSVLVTGVYGGSLTLGSTTLGGSAVGYSFVAKMDMASGSYTWANRVAGTSYGSSVAVNATGEVVVVGTSSASTTFFPVGSLAYVGGSSDAFVAKLTSAGVWTWAKRMAGTGQDEGSDVAFAASGDVITIGTFGNGSASVNGTAVTGAGANDIVVARFIGATGDTRWTLVAGSPGDDRGVGLALDASGRITVAGLFKQTAVFGSTSLVSGAASTTFNAYVARVLDTGASGTWQYALKASSPADTRATTVAVNPATGATALPVSSNNGPVTFQGLAPATGSGFLAFFGPPTALALSATSLDENVPAGTVVGALSTTDSDLNDTFTYSLVSGAGSTDNAAFSIGTGVNAGKLLLNASPDYEAKTSYSIRVRTTDQGGLAFDKFFTINVVDLIEDRIVSATESILPGTYHDFTVASGGTANLTGNLTITGTLTVAAGGTLNTACQIVLGTGAFTLADGGTITICDPSGLTQTAAAGAVQVTGLRSYSTDATYGYGTNNPQVTGDGLPTLVRALNLTGKNTVTLTRGLEVKTVINVASLANLSLNNLPLTLRSDATASAYVVNSGTGRILGNTATVQRYITDATNGGLGYRHLSAPVAGATVGSLAAPGFVPVVNGRYNAAAVPTGVRPFPNVFGFDETRLPAQADFGSGYFSPAATATSTALTEGLAVGRGYSLYNAAKTHALVGTLNTGNVVTTLTRTGATAKSGWNLLGNPYPAPISWDNVAVPTGMSSTIYVLKPLPNNAYVYLTRQSNGNGTGTGTLSGGLLPIAQGFFAEATTNNTAFTFRNTHRLTTAANPEHYRNAPATAAPTLSLVLRDVAAVSNWAQDEAFVVFHPATTGASATYDSAFDGQRPGHNVGVPTLATLLPTQEELAIDGRSETELAAGTTIELLTDVPAAGTYQFSLGQLTNLAGQSIVLRDRLTGTAYDLLAQPVVTFTTTQPGETRNRFALEVNLSRVLGTAAASALTPTKLVLQPNPATGGTVRLLGPDVVSRPAIVLDAAGRVIRTTTIGADGTLSIGALAPGVYVVRVGTATARLVVE